MGKERKALADQRRYLLAFDTGGTITDIFLVDSEGRFVVGRAGTTPQNEKSIGFWESLGSAEFHGGGSYWYFDFIERR